MPVAHLSMPPAAAASGAASAVTSGAAAAAFVCAGSSHPVSAISETATANPVVKPKRISILPFNHPFAGRSPAGHYIYHWRKYIFARPFMMRRNGASRGRRRINSKCRKLFAFQR
jgi:hypothetical protein